jgi:ferredoxin
VCVVECPAEAIIQENDLPEDQRKIWYDINSELSTKWPNITKQKDPLPDAEQWKNVPNKIVHLEK